MLITLSAFSFARPSLRAVVRIGWSTNVKMATTKKGTHAHTVALTMEMPSSALDEKKLWVNSPLFLMPRFPALGVDWFFFSLWGKLSPRMGRVCRSISVGDSDTLNVSATLTLIVVDYEPRSSPIAAAIRAAIISEPRRRGSSAK
jgi:hypothetical protein